MFAAAFQQSVETALDGLRFRVLGNTLGDYLLALLLFFASLAAIQTFKSVFLKRLQAHAAKTASKTDDMVIGLVRKTLFPVLYAGALYLAANQLALNAATDKLLTAFAVIVLTVQVTRLVLAVIIYFIERNWFRKETQKGGTPVSRSVLTLVRVVFWGLGLVFILDNLGFNISAVVAGLGIGGVAVALAAQTILGDLFNYFVIFFDKPFEEGDFVVFDDCMGIIENIGIKSTRIRSLGGEQIVISNSSLTASRIRNYKRMAERRVLFKVGVTYETSIEKLRKIPALVREIIQGLPNTRFDRAHFRDFGDFSLNFEVVYYFRSPDYNQYMDTQEAINLSLKEAFEKEGIEFAYPTSVEYQKPLTGPVQPQPSSERS